VVALGAAMQANVLWQQAAGEDWLLLDVIPLSLALKRWRLVEKIIPRNSTIPAARAQEFTTFKDGRPHELPVVQGSASCLRLPLARPLRAEGHPADAAGAARVRVTFQVDADGLLSVTARESTTGAEASVNVKPPMASRMPTSSACCATRSRMRRRTCMRARLPKRARWRALLEATRSRWQPTAPCSAEEKASIGARMAELEKALQGADHRAIKHAVDALNHATEDFAARRMDEGIRRALAGSRSARSDAASHA